MEMIDKPVVFINTNDNQVFGAKVAMYSMKKFSRNAEKFEVKLNRFEETPHLLKRQGQTYLRKGRPAVWHNEDLQSWSPLRRKVPQMMGFKGRALVTDPDVFAIGDVFDLLNVDMKGKAILCRNISEGYKGNGHAFYASSVMLLDCSLLTHWNWDEEIDQMFKGDLDYGPWISLKAEDPESIGEIGEEWNSFDKLTPETKLLHTTERGTQPWKTGLPIDFDLNINSIKIPKTSSARSLIGGLIRDLSNMFKMEKTVHAQIGQKYQPHPDPAQEKLFFELLRGAMEEDYIDEGFLRKHIKENNVRHDAFDVLKAMGYRAKCSSV
jgi:hypothetical protein